MSVLDSFFTQEHFYFFKDEVVSSIRKDDPSLADKLGYSKKEIEKYYTLIEKVALKTPFKDRNNQQHVICAWHEFNKGNLKTAQKYAEEAHSTFSPSNALLAEIALRNNDLPTASKHIDELLKTDKKYAPAYVIQAQILEQQSSQTDEIIKFLKNISRSGVHYFPITPYLASLNFKSGKYESVHGALQDYYQANFLDNKIFAFISGLEIISYAKYAKHLGLTEAIFNWTDALKKRKIDLLSSTYFSQEEKNYIKGTILLFENIAAIEDSLIRLDIVKNPNTKQHEVLSSLKISLKENLPKLLRNEDHDEEAKKSLTEALNTASKELDKKSQAGRIVANIFLAIGLLGVGYLIAGYIYSQRTNGRHFALFADKQLRNVEKIADQINRLSAPLPRGV